MEKEEGFFESIKREGSDPFAELEKETPSESLTEKEPEKEEPQEGESTPEEKDVPFHKHPRWIERETELKTLREQEEAHAREIAELRTEVSHKLESNDTSIPEWFRELYGDSASAWKKYEHREKERETEIEQRLIQRQELAEKQKVEEATRWNKWVDGELEQLQSEGHKFDRNKLIKTMLDFRPTDDSNNFDFRKGLAIYQALEEKEKTKDVEKSNARKELADTTTKVSRGDPPQKDYLTAKDLRHRSWGSL